MAMPAYPPFPERTLWTVADLEQLPEDGNRSEILHGELLVTPLPSTGHQGVAARLLLLVANWCRAHTGWRFLAPGGVYISETNWLEPDVAVYPSPEFDNRPWRELPPPLWVAEVLSPSTRSRDRHSKRAAYLTNGVADVWIVDPDARTIECWSSGSEFPEICRDFAVWVPDEHLPALIVSTDELFGPPAP
jgi:Uma2 family endonuclease